MSSSAISRRFTRPLGLLRRPEFLVFLPAITLAAFWTGGESALLICALGLPLAFALAGPGAVAALGAVAGPAPSSHQVLDRLEFALSQAKANGNSTACLVLQFDSLSQVISRHGRAAAQDALDRVLDRLRQHLRADDFVSPPQDGACVIVLSPVRRLLHDDMLQLCTRLQDHITAPLPLGRVNLQLSACIGFCTNTGTLAPSAQTVLAAAQIATEEAVAQGEGAIRAYSVEMGQRHADRLALRDDLLLALENGDIVAYFQPQLCTDTGEISGMEALARWPHPKRGLLLPRDFLPLIDNAEMSARLSRIMLDHALTALRYWHSEGLQVPQVAVNFSATDLRDVTLPQRVQAALLRNGLLPRHLTVEILETVVAQSDNGTIAATIAHLAQLGCGVDLDDFGSGHASIASIRRFAIKRLKIDRSFVTRVDQDRDQQRLVSAIVSLAERLELETLAEGVETRAEHAMLAQLGCGFVQGYVLAYPLPMAEARNWIANHQSRPDFMPQLGMSRQ